MKIKYEITVHVILRKVMSELHILGPDMFN